MADNTTLNTMTGGDIIADEDVAGVKFQKIKLIDPTPGSTTPIGTKTNPQKVQSYDADLGVGENLTSLRDRMVAQRYTVLSDSVADGLASFWTQTTATGGTITVTGGEGLLQTSAAAGGSAQLNSSVVVYYPGQSSWFNSAFRFGDTGVAGNIRRLGIFTVTGTTPNDGHYFELNGTTFNAVVIKNGVVQSSVDSTTWTKAAINPFTLDTNYHSFEIRFTANGVQFYIDNLLRHTYTGTTTAITNTLNFPMTAQNINSTNATNVVLAVRNLGIGRFGEPDTTPTTNSSPATTTASTTVSATGDNTVIAAVASKRIKLLWYNLQAKASNAGAATAILKGTIGGVVTQINIGDYSASQPFAHTIGAGQKSIIFDTNTPVIVNLLSSTNPVYFNAEYDLV